MASKKKKKRSQSSGSVDNSSNRKSKPLSPEETKKIIKERAREEALKLLAELNLQLINSGNTLDERILKKQLKEKYGVEFRKEKINKSDTEIPVSDVEKQEIKK